MRVPRTFVFVDLSGFTNYTAAFGDDAAGRLLSTFRAIVRDVASERGVRIAKWLGDGCMVVSASSSPMRSTFVLDLEQRAADVCAPLTVRAGIATGHALLFEGDDYIGSAVNMAARLCDYARGVEVLMPTMQIERLPEGVDARPYGDVELRGFPGPIERRRADRSAGGRQRRRRRPLDPHAVHLNGSPAATVPMTFERGASLTTATTLGFSDAADLGPTAGNGFHTSWRDDLAALSELGLTALRIPLDWARLQPKPGELDGNWAEWFDDVLTAVDADRATGVGHVARDRHPPVVRQRRGNGRCRHVHEMVAALGRARRRPLR